MNAIYNNFLYLKEKLNSEGFNVYAIGDNSVDYNIHPKDILQKFKIVESNIEEIRTALSAFSTKHEERFEWLPHTTGRRERVWYWIDLITQSYEYANKYSVLFDINNEKIYDINGNEIIVLQEGER
jgi:hypothetical protein